MNITTLRFPFRLHPSRVHNFRAAVVEQVGYGHYLFHGHDNSRPGQMGYSNAFPLIRFGVRKDRAIITGMGEGANALIVHLLPVLPHILVVAGEPLDTSGYQLTTHNWLPQVSSEPTSFGIYKWIALNKANYLDWKKLEGKEAARRMLLDRCLTGHLRALAEATGLERTRIETIHGRVLRQDKQKRIAWKSSTMVAFDVVVEANFSPPYGLGLGRCHSFGFGEICSPHGYSSLVSNRRRKHTAHSEKPRTSVPAPKELDL